MLQQASMLCIPNAPARSALSLSRGRPVILLLLLLQVDWKDPAMRPAVPAMLGTKAYLDFPIEEVLPYIDWNPFFQVCDSCFQGCVCVEGVGWLSGWLGGQCHLYVAPTKL